LTQGSEFNRWLGEFPQWRAYIFGLMAHRLSNIIDVVEEVASDLGTSREVVSRILKDFENVLLIRVSQGAIGILNPKGIADTAMQT